MRKWEDDGHEKNHLQHQEGEYEGVVERHLDRFELIMLGASREVELLVRSKMEEERWGAVQLLWKGNVVVACGQHVNRRCQRVRVALFQLFLCDIRAYVIAAWRLLQPRIRTRSANSTEETDGSECFVSIKPFEFVASLQNLGRPG